MNKEVKELWVKKLRELPNNMQGQGALEDTSGKMCCLGVLCRLGVEAGIQEPPTTGVSDYLHYPDQGIDRSGTLTRKVRDWAGLRDANPMLGEKQASEWNDFDGKSFDEIAQLIEDNL